MQKHTQTIFTTAVLGATVAVTCQVAQARQETVTKSTETVTKRNGSTTITKGRTVVTPNGTRRVIQSTTVRRTGSGLVGAQVTLSGNNLQRTVNGRGTNYVVNGNGNNLMLNGTFQSLTINGNRNNIRATTVGSIVATGNNNQVTWVRGMGGRPDINNSGRGNRISRSR